MSAPLRIGINGLGRIGRCVVRALAERADPGIVLMAVNGPADTETHRRLLQYDSVHGRFPGTITAEGDRLHLPGMAPVPVLHERDIAALDWAALGVDIVLECTGAFTSRDGLERHLAAGAKKAILSAPAKGEDVPTIVYGVNEATLTPDTRFFSIGSCTTNCLAPVAKALHGAFGIHAGFMTTVHAYTADQNLVDGSHKDPRRARAAALSMIPTSTGAAKALGLVLPELKGKLDGVALRVPTPNVSMVDLCVQTERPVTQESVQSALRAAADGAIVQCTEEPLVSIDFSHSSASAVIDLTATQVVGDRFVRVAAWYDNEWGFSCRMLDLAALAGTL